MHDDFCAGAIRTLGKTEINREVAALFFDVTSPCSFRSSMPTCTVHEYINAAKQKCQLHVVNNLMIGYQAFGVAAAAPCLPADVISASSLTVF